MGIGPPPKARTAGLLCLLIAALAAAGCLGGKKTEYVTVGAVLSMRGDHPYPDLHAATGLTIAKDEVNRAGGLLGKQLDIIVYDDGGDPERARELYDSLVERGAVAVICSGRGALAAALGEKADPDSVLLVIPTPQGHAYPPPYVHHRSPIPLDSPGRPAKTLADTYYSVLLQPPRPSSVSAYVGLRALAEAIKGEGSSERDALVRGLARGGGRASVAEGGE